MIADERLPVSQDRTMKTLVGERGFEPPTPGPETRFRSILKLVEICDFYLIDIEPVASRSLKAVEVGSFWVLSQLQNCLQSIETIYAWELLEPLLLSPANTSHITNAPLIP